MRKFRKPFDDSKKGFKPSNSGNRFYTEYKLIFEPDGNMNVEAVKSRDRVAEIQSYRDSCDVNMLIKRYENGDQTALLRNNTGVYCDITSMPNNVHDAVKFSKSVDKLYDSLGSDIKNFYPSKNEFLEAFSDREHFNNFIDNANVVFKQRVANYKKSEVDSDA